MTEEEIKEIIHKLKIQYIIQLEEHNYSLMVDVHDEITRWERELKEKFGTKERSKK